MREFGAKARTGAVVGVEVVEAKAEVETAIEVETGVECSIPAFFLKTFSPLMTPPRLELSE